LQADLNGRWRQGGEDQISNALIHRLSTDRLTAWPAKGRCQLTH
jgi:hypothetical protein